MVVKECPLCGYSMLILDYSTKPDPEARAKDMEKHMNKWREYAEHVEQCVEQAQLARKIR